MTDGYDDPAVAAPVSASAGRGTPVDRPSADQAPADTALVAAVEDALSGPDHPVENPQRQLGADPHDFAGLYIRHRTSFGYQARRYLRDQRDVDEVVQEAFLRLFLALPELETELQALAYCRRTVTNLCIDRYRADMRRPKLVNLDAVPAHDLPDEEPDDPVVQAEDAAFVREALSLLTPLHRQALVKREIEEKSIPVIAAELDIPEESVKHLLHRARRALRRHLAKTHLAPGADLESTSTLALLGRSAAASGGKLGVVVVLLGLVLLGTRPAVTKTVLTSWPLGDILPAVTHALAPAPTVTPPAPADARSPARVAPAPVEGLRGPASTATLPQTDTFVSLAIPTLAPSPLASAVASSSPSPTASGSASPAPPVAAPTPDASASSSGSPSASPSGSPSGSASPSPSPSESTSSSPSSSPSARSSASPVRANSQVAPGDRASWFVDPAGADL